MSTEGENNHLESVASGLAPHSISQRQTSSWSFEDQFLSAQSLAAKCKAVSSHWLQFACVALSGSAIRWGSATPAVAAELIQLF